MEILAQPLCETVFTPTTFRHTKRLPIRISKPSHKKFHFKKTLPSSVVVLKIWMFKNHRFSTIANQVNPTLNMLEFIILIKKNV
jgi:hypothetical protein